MSTPTAPIPNRFPAPNPTPNRPTECERCGAPAISQRGVAKHDLWHRAQDVAARRQESLLTALEEMLTVFDGDPDPDTGERKTFRAWITETDHILDAIHEAIEQLEQRPEPAPTTLEHAEPEILPWPGNPYADEEDAPDDFGGGTDLPGEAGSDALAGELDAASASPQPHAIAEHVAARIEDDDDDLDAIDHPSMRTF